MRRLREVSRFECDVRVMRNGFCTTCFPSQSQETNLYTGRPVRSSDLVPGDVYEVSDPELEQFPCDSLLLSGDCIINESMLTGIWSASEANFALTICRGVSASVKDPSYQRLSDISGE